MKKYEILAGEIDALIAAETLRPGERLPSVRETSIHRLRGLFAAGGAGAHRGADAFRLFREAAGTPA